MSYSSNELEKWYKYNGDQYNLRSSVYSEGRGTSGSSPSLSSLASLYGRVKAWITPDPSTSNRT